jgi:hypothetical protein
MLFLDFDLGMGFEFRRMLGGCGIGAFATLATLDVFESKMGVVIR